MPGCAESRCDDREASSLITRRVTVGDSSDSPRATTRMACSSSAGSHQGAGRPGQPEPACRPWRPTGRLGNQRFPAGVDQPREVAGEQGHEAHGEGDEGAANRPPHGKRVHGDGWRQEERADRVAHGEVDDRQRDRHHQGRQRPHPPPGQGDHGGRHEGVRPEVERPGAAGPRRGLPGAEDDDEPGERDDQAVEHHDPRDWRPHHAHADDGSPGPGVVESAPGRRSATSAGVCHESPPVR